MCRDNFLKNRKICVLGSAKQGNLGTKEQRNSHRRTERFLAQIAKNPK
jgi:hypothetical protein